MAVGTAHADFHQPNPQRVGLIVVVLVSGERTKPGETISSMLYPSSLHSVVLKHAGDEEDDDGDDAVDFTEVVLYHSQPVQSPPE